MRTLKALTAVVVFGVFAYIATPPRIGRLPVSDGGIITGVYLYADTANSPVKTWIMKDSLLFPDGSWVELHAVITKPTFQADTTLDVDRLIFVH